MAAQNPILALMPPEPVLLAVQQTDPGGLHQIFERISATGVEMVEIAHREDHAAAELGGDHMRTRQVAVAIENGLMERYEQSPRIIARLYTDLLLHTGLAATSEELHAALTEEERQKVQERDRG